MRDQLTDAEAAALGAFECLANGQVAAKEGRIDHLRELCLHAELKKDKLLNRNAPEWGQELSNVWFEVHMALTEALHGVDNNESFLLAKSEMIFNSAAAQTVDFMFQQIADGQRADVEAARVMQSLQGDLSKESIYSKIEDFKISSPQSIYMALTNKYLH